MHTDHEQKNLPAEGQKAEHQPMLVDTHLQNAKNALYTLFLTKTNSRRWTEEQWNTFEGEYRNVKQHLETHLEGEAKSTALGFLSKIPEVHYLIARVAKKRGVHYAIVLKEEFPELIPEEFVQCKKERGINSEGQLQWEPYLKSDEHYAKRQLLRFLEEGEHLQSNSEIPFDITQSEFPGYFYGFPLAKIESIFQKGIVSRRKTFPEKQQGGKFDTSETAFPMFVSLARPIHDYSIDENTKRTGYRYSSIYNSYGPGDRVKQKIAAIIDPQYIVPRSFLAAEVEWGYYITHKDEYESTVDTIPADKIVGFICHPEQKDTMISILEKQKKAYHLYDTEGNMLWPKEMKKEDVEKEFQEKFLNTL